MKLYRGSNVRQVPAQRNLHSKIQQRKCDTPGLGAASLMPPAGCPSSAPPISEAIHPDGENTWATK